MLKTSHRPDGLIDSPNGSIITLKAHPEMFDPSTTAFAQRLYGTRPLDHHMYNWVVENRDTLTYLIEIGCEAPLSAMLRTGALLPRRCSPKQLIDRMREGLHKDEWKSLLALSDTGIEIDFDAMRLMAAINGRHNQDLSNKAIEQATTIVPKYLNGHYASTVMVVASMLDRAPEDSEERTARINEARRDLVDMTDYITSQQGPTPEVLRSYSYSTLQNNSLIWHQDFDSKYKYENHRRWDCPWGTRVVGDYTVVSLDDTSKLIEEGRAMHHCVGGYTSRCITEGLRIFSVRSEDSERLSTLTLGPLGGGSWYIQQHRALQNHPVTRGENSLAIRMCELYSEAIYDASRDALMPR